MSTDGVRKSAFNIILAARFCNFRSRSMFEDDVKIVRWPLITSFQCIIPHLIKTILAGNINFLTYFV